jgi:alkyl sulfatase BDS1-like metallo-beta-lactamase superfamily hydrolase
MPEDARGDATQFTKAANARLLDELPFEDQQDFDDATRGFIAPLIDQGIVKDDETGRVLWDPTKFSFIEDGSPAPDTVNPSLWRVSQLCLKGGLFKVAERLYQVRNQDISNLTIVEGDTGLILMDPLVSPECARAALELYFQHRPRKPVVAMIHSHSHADHYGGVKGVISEDDVKAGRTKVIAPVGFLAAAVSENVLAGNVMTRRTFYQYGTLLPRDPKGMVGVGLGADLSSGRITLIPPTDEISETGQKMVIDGLTFEFLLAPDTEAPAEMHWFIEELGALTAAENCCHTLHNTYTLRGAQIRDPQAWSRYLNETIDRWGDKSEVMYGMHHWPVWGSDRVVDTLRKGRDAYRYINDQTLRLANHGYTPVEIAEMLEFPESLDHHWGLRGYYGTLNHNVKATYVKYLGWFDGNPANLHVLPPEDSAKRYVEFMGGAEAVIKKAQKAYEQGEYRWVAEVVNHVVFADPSNQAARNLQADAVEQLGYQSEAGTWRGLYLTAAKELREGVTKLPIQGTASPDSVRAMTLELLLNYMGVRLKGLDAAPTTLTINVQLTDTSDQAVIELTNGSLNHSLGRQADDADATLKLTKEALTAVFLGEKTPGELVSAGQLDASPDTSALDTLLGLLDTFDLWFNIIEP